MISYAPLWETMKRRGISTYSLIKDYSFSRGTLDSLKHDRNISTATLNDLLQNWGEKMYSCLAPEQETGRI